MAPRNDVERCLAEIWADVLGLEQVGVYDDFFELGGHSLLAMQIISRVRNLLRIEVSVRRLFKMPTVAEFATLVERTAPIVRYPEPPTDLPSGAREEIAL